MMSAWISFIKTGNPNSKDLAVFWPEFTQTKREMMAFAARTNFIRQHDNEEWSHRDGDEAFHSLVEQRILARKSFGFLRL